MEILSALWNEVLWASTAYSGRTRKQRYFEWIPGCNSGWCDSYFPLIPGWVSPDCERNCSVYWILVQITHSPLKPNHSPTSYYQLPGAVNTFAKSHSAILVCQLPWGFRKVAQPVSLMSFASLALEWVPCRSSTMWNALGVGKALR